MSSARAGSALLLDSDPGAATSATKSSFAVTLANAITYTAEGS